jgi:Na+-driven multidrug efflux pump|tara:strand:- start:17277 stop:17435 length:159 start_codon:yes stop_codon:yes gene_type:complete
MMLSSVIAVVLLVYYFKTSEKHVSINFSLWHTNSQCLKKLLPIGFLGGGEFF